MEVSPRRGLLSLSLSCLLQMHPLSSPRAIMCGFCYNTPAKTTPPRTSSSFVVIGCSASTTCRLFLLWRRDGFETTTTALEKRRSRTRGSQSRGKTSRRRFSRESSRAVGARSDARDDASACPPPPPPPPWWTLLYENNEDVCMCAKRA